ncbi:Glutathione synthetase (EC 6.3.2.3) [uncultured Gammaproteobacteria bacterium]|uniref:glutathione synthase n=1 Tax=Bathymodiolus heckerae thiotrophic gill symbiont TaxID=1052212 RepID=UPI0010B0D94E|nr:glutathione synthase [Bathymodiolus heckerae thiotrophic gill symbiont]CAC9589500.1 Glutathione synthetase (EC 6.3.2.3) [uncultured Gammaproteobacteria bacterium]CAC9595554.1 Glutathione synthetase (EC 6.3.2.3) [uncultured Gammaproteobacteria bacterium]CAC9954868.1 Glutathione synthetase (EC 6.3.2.3) [uncultured Gammaproteobacteria bacterium]CAC9959193.1 Glutathione synthetase (EC 6.3.2.3) [uncultured Gammaproteobacteria bacterium]SHN91189.1 Glutathione synthetase [Bathymodiolus heckerae th
MKLIKIGVLMDDIKNIKPHKDSSLAMMLEASRRHWEIYTFDSNDLFAQEGRVLATCAKTRVFDNTTHWYEQEPKADLPLDDFDVILMRKDPPFDMNYIYATYFLEQAENKGVLVVNKAQSLRDVNEKLFALNFPHCIAKTLVSSNKDRLKVFIKTQGISVVKPLDGMGGKDIFKLEWGDSNIDEVLDYITHQGNTPIMAQEFLPEIAQGDKRILLINGEPIDYALARLPAEGSFKGNLAAGATGVGQPLSDRDRYLCKQISPTLKAKGLMFVGLDVIGDYITEINVTSPTCIRELDEQFNLSIAGVLFDEIEKKLARK